MEHHDAAHIWLLSFLGRWLLRVNRLFYAAYGWRWWGELFKLVQITSVLWVFGWVYFKYAQRVMRMWRRGSRTIGVIFVINLLILQVKLSNSMLWRKRVAPRLGLVEDLPWLIYLWLGSPVSTVLVRVVGCYLNTPFFTDVSALGIQFSVCLGRILLGCLIGAILVIRLLLFPTRQIWVGFILLRREV